MVCIIRFNIFHCKHKMPFFGYSGSHLVQLHIFCSSVLQFICMVRMCMAYKTKGKLDRWAKMLMFMKVFMNANLSLDNKLLWTLMKLMISKTRAGCPPEKCNSQSNCCRLVLELLRRVHRQDQGWWPLVLEFCLPEKSATPTLANELLQMSLEWLECRVKERASIFDAGWSQTA